MSSLVSIRKCNDYVLEDVYASMQKVFADLGGLDAIFCQGQKVLLKPNLLLADSIDNASTTHPIVVEAIIIALKELGCSVFVGDGPAFGSVESVAESCGVGAVAKKHNVQIVSFKSNKDVYRGVLPEASSILNQFDSKRKKRIMALSRVTSSVHDYDRIVNLPKLKAHSQMTMTAAVKNLYGLIEGKIKMGRHVFVNNDMELFACFILHLCERVSSELTIVDAITTMEEIGPRNGVPTKRGLLFGGIDPVAVDRVILHLTGKMADFTPLMKYASKYKFGSSDLAKISLLGDLDANMQDFKFPEKVIDVSFSLKRAMKSVLKQFWLKIQGK